MQHYITYRQIDTGSAYDIRIILNTVIFIASFGYFVNTLYHTTQ